MRLIYLLKWIHATCFLNKYNLRRCPAAHELLPVWRQQGLCLKYEPFHCCAAALNTIIRINKRFTIHICND